MVFAWLQWKPKRCSEPQIFGRYGSISSNGTYFDSDKSCGVKKEYYQNLCRATARAVAFD